MVVLYACLGPDAKVLRGHVCMYTTIKLQRKKYTNVEIVLYDDNLVCVPMFVYNH